MECAEVQWHSVDPEFTNQVRDLQRRRATDAIGGDRHDRPAAQGVFSEGDQVAAWSHFDKDSRSVFVHLLDQLREFDRPFPMLDG